MRALGTVMVLLALGGATACGDDGSAATDTTATVPSTTVPATTTSALDYPPGDRGDLQRRLTEELDPATAAAVVGAMTDQDVDGLVEAADGDVAASPLLSYTPSTVPDDEVDSLWIFAYGFRFAPGAGIDSVALGETVPPTDQLVPGPTNESLARAAAEFVAEHPVPIVAQWEVALVLEDLGVPDVIAVEPDVAADGTVTYLSTAGVADKGLRLAADAGVEAGHAGVLCFADHAVRCLMTAEAAGITADVPAGVELPADYDPESGQEWTRSREAWVPVDLAGRRILVG